MSNMELPSGLKVKGQRLKVKIIMVRVMAGEACGNYDISYRGKVVKCRVSYIEVTHFVQIT